MFSEQCSPTLPDLCWLECSLASIPLRRNKVEGLAVMAAIADRLFSQAVKKPARRGSTSWLHPAPHTNDEDLVNRILSPGWDTQPVSSALEMTKPAVDQATGKVLPIVDFVVKGNHTFYCPVRIQAVGGGFIRSDDDAGIVTVSHDKKRIYCPKIDMKEIATYEFDDVSDATVTTDEFFERSILPLVDEAWKGRNAMAVLCGGHGGVDTMIEGDSGGDDAIGLIHLAAANLFSRPSAHSLQGSSGSSQPIRLSWYEIRGSKIVDLLAAAAATPDASRKLETPVFTEGGPNKSIQVSCLLEVEARCGEDIRQVVSGVRARVKRRRSNVTSVINLSLDGITFSMVAMAAARSAGGEYASWVTEVARTLESLRAKTVKTRVSKNEFRSNSMLLLRDGLLRRCAFAFIPCITGDLDDARETLDSLQLGAQIFEYCHGAGLSAGSSPRSSPAALTRQDKTKKRSPSQPATQKKQSAALPSSKKTPSSAPFSTVSAKRSNSTDKNSREGSEYIHPPSSGTPRLRKSPMKGGKGSPASMVPIPSSNSSPNSTPYFTSNKAQEILPESSPSLEALAQSPLHGSTRRANERASPVKFAMEDAVPPVSEMLDMVGRTYGDSARSWLKNTISASHRARSDVEFLKEENERLRIAHRGRQAESSDQSEAIKTLKRKIREKNTELKEYELYKDVMESTVTKQSKELREAIEQRDKLRARLKKETTNASKQVLSMKQKVSHAKKQGKAAKMEVEGSIQKLSQQLQACKRTLKTRDDALLVLENTFMASEQENRALIARVAASGDTIKALENDLENVISERDTLLAEIRKVEVAFGRMREDGEIHGVQYEGDDEKKRSTKQQPSPLPGSTGNKNMATTNSIAPPPAPPTPLNKDLKVMKEQKTPVPRPRGMFPARSKSSPTTREGYGAQPYQRSSQKAMTVRGGEKSMLNSGAMKTVKNAQDSINRAKNVVASIRARRDGRSRIY